MANEKAGKALKGIATRAGRAESYIRIRLTVPSWPHSFNAPSSTAPSALNWTTDRILRAGLPFERVKQVRRIGLGFRRDERKSQNRTTQFAARDAGRETPFVAVISASLLAGTATKPPERREHSGKDRCYLNA